MVILMMMFQDYCMVTNKSGHKSTPTPSATPFSIRISPPLQAMPVYKIFFQVSRLTAPSRPRTQSMTRQVKLE